MLFTAHVTHIFSQPSPHGYVVDNLQIQIHLTIFCHLDQSLCWESDWLALQNCLARLEQKFFLAFLISASFTVFNTPQWLLIVCWLWYICLRMDMMFFGPFYPHEPSLAACCSCYLNAHGSAKCLAVSLLHGYAYKFWSTNTLGKPYNMHIIL